MVGPQGLPRKVYKYVDVSKDNGTPKSSILIGFSIINHPFGGTIIFGNTHVDILCGEKFIILSPRRNQLSNWKTRYEGMEAELYHRVAWWTTLVAVVTENPEVPGFWMEGGWRMKRCQTYFFFLIC